MDELLDYVTQLIDYIEANGSRLSAETQRELGVFLQEVMQFIAEQERPIETLVQQPQLEPGPYPSSNINAFKYDYPSKRLLVKFQGKDVADNGPIYAYEGVQPFIYDIFRKGAVPPKTSGRNKWHRWKQGVMPSLGAAMYHLIRNGNYQYQRLS